MWHPWRRLRALAHVDLHWADLPAGVRGVTAGNRIWLDLSQLQAERRCTLAHELEHLERGHDGCVSGAEERRVREAAARRLITLERLLDVAAWTRCPAEAAEELWVDEDTLNARLEGLTPSEARALRGLWN